jgi:predicted secreted protein
MTQLGNNILVYLNGTAIAGTKSNEIQTDCDMIEVTNQNSAQWRQYLAGRKNWSVSTGFLVLAAADTKKLLNVGTTYTLRFRDRAGTSILQGQAIMKQCKISAARGSLATGSFTFQGSGELAEV